MNAMDLTLELTDCTELDHRGRRCLAPATLTRLEPVVSTHGLVEVVATRCLFGHVLRMPASMLVGAG